jgi:hypothetical protein
MALGNRIRDSFDLPPLKGDETDTVKTPAEIAVMRANPSQNKVPDALWPVYDDFMQYDVVFGAINLNRAMKSLIKSNAKYYPEITQGIVKGIDGPFPQVVLVTDAGKQLHDTEYVQSDIKPALHAIKDVTDVTKRPLKANQETTESLLPRIAHRRREFNVTELL